METVTVELRNVILHGHHGIHPEEKEVMNTFEVNLDVTYGAGNARFGSLEDTISYASLHDIVKREIGQPALLLERICQQLIQKIKNQYPSVQEVKVTVYKLHAPIAQFQGKVGVTMHRRFTD